MRNSLAGAVLALLLMPAAADAQTTLSTELSAPGTLDLSVEFLGSVARRGSGGFEWYLTDLTFGVTPRLEIGAGWSALVPRSPEEPHEILPHAKFKVMDRGVTLVTGAALHAPISNRADSEAYGWIYAVGSREIELTKPVTISAGIYELVHRDPAIGDSRRGLSLAVDQTLTDRWSYGVEWISGTNWYGYLSASVTFVSGASWFTGGYCVGNDRTANHGPCFSAGRTF